MATNTDPQWYQDMVRASALGPAYDKVVTAQDGPFTLAPQVETPNTITCMAGGVEMLKVGDKGFWVRGVKVEQDEQEAQKVYEAFKAWMMWAQMTRDYE